jgi:hypothetical protein
MAAFEKDVKSGTPLPVLVQRHLLFLFPSRETLTSRFRMLHRAQVGCFRRLRDDEELPRPPGAQVSLPVVPVLANQVTWQQGTGTGTGGDPYVVFQLPSAAFVREARVRMWVTNPTAERVAFQAYWKKQGQDFSEAQRTMHLELDAARQEADVVVPINDTIETLRIDPDNKPCTFKISQITLIVPQKDSPGLTSSRAGSEKARPENAGKG